MSWELPTRCTIGGAQYDLHCDFRDVLEIFRYLNDGALPEQLRWRIALALFYEPQVPPIHWAEALSYMTEFLSYGSGAQQKQPLLDWERDAPLIVADVNRVAGREIRATPFLHWWTFLGYFYALPPGQLSTVLAIRQKLRRGKKLLDWEQEYYRENRDLVDLPVPLTAREQEEKQKLSAMLGT